MVLCSTEGMAPGVVVGRVVVRGGEEMEEMDRENMVVR